MKWSGAAARELDGADDAERVDPGVWANEEHPTARKQATPRKPRPGMRIIAAPLQ
jgi:hypothetical protein